VTQQPARAAGGVEHPPLKRLEHLDQQPGDRRWREVLAAAVALRAGELLDEVLIRTPKDVARCAGVRAEADLRDRLHQRAHQLGRERRAGVDAREHFAQTRVFPLDRGERIVDPPRDVGPGGRDEQRRPTGGLGNPEDVLGDVLVAVLKRLRPRRRVLDVCLAPRRGDLVLERRAALLEGVGDVLQDEQPQDEVLVF